MVGARAAEGAMDYRRIAKDAALVAAATLSHCYITDRFVRDKVIDLVDT